MTNGPDEGGSPVQPDDAGTGAPGTRPFASPLGGSQSGGTPEAGQYGAHEGNNPGAQQPETQQPGEQQPGEQQPGEQQLGEQQVGAQQPSGQFGPGQPQGYRPTSPLGAPGWEPYGRPPSGGIPQPGYPGAPLTGQQPQPAAPRKGLSLTLVAILFVVIAALAAVGGGLVGAALVDNNSSSNTTMTVANSGDPQPAVKGSVQEVAQKVLPSVVSIYNQAGQESGSGSGVVISADGKIVTNNHVIAGNGKLTVAFSDGSTSPARVIGADTVTDVAVVQTDKTGLTPIVIGDSGKLAVGQDVVAVGAPLGLSSTVTSGIVSALNRPVATSGRDSDQATVVNSVQTDAAINPGNSGGALVDMNGSLIGINSSIASLGTQSAGGQSGSIGLGFAIPSNLVKRIAAELIQSGKATHAALGVSVATGQQSPSTPGAIVSNVAANGSAGRAGIPNQARVIKVDDLQITDGLALIGAVRSYAPGSKVNITYLAPGSSNAQTTQVTLGSLDR
jgi:putative serine protease PepD